MSLYDQIADRMTGPNVPLLEDLWSRTQAGTAAQQQQYANQQKQIDQQTAAARNIVASGPRPSQGIIDRAKGEVQTMTADQVNQILPDHAWSSTLGDYNPQTTNPDGSPRQTPYVAPVPAHTHQMQAVRAAPAAAPAAAAPNPTTGTYASPSASQLPFGMTQDDYERAKAGIGPVEWVNYAMGGG